MAWTPETQSIAAQLRDHLGRVLDGHTRRQVAAWVTAWDDIAPELEATLNDLVLGAVDGRIRRRDMATSQRLLNALELVDDRIRGLVGASAADVIDQLREVLDYAGSLQERLIASQLPAGGRGDVQAWSRVSAAAVDAMVMRTTQQITSRSRPLADDAAAVMRRQLVRGVAVGSNPRVVAARMLRDTEGTFNGGLGRALTIARTEMLDAHREASALEDAANADLLTGWVWTSVLGLDTCPACWAMHGTEFPLDQPGPQGHQNCRCARVAKTKSWRELGFDIDEPPSLLPDAETAFEQLSRDQQVAILGPARFAAWEANAFPMSAWSTLQRNDGWRDSWVIASPPEAFRGIRRANLPGLSPADGTVALRGSDGEAMRPVLPSTYLSGVRAVPAPAYRVFDDIADFTVASTTRPRGYLSDAETAVADALDELGLATRGVLEARRPRPDAVTADLEHRIEFKTLSVSSYDRIRAEARRGSLQSRQVVLDMRGTALERTEALQHLGRIARSALGPRLDEIGLLLADGTLVSWSRYA